MSNSKNNKTFAIKKYFHLATPKQLEQWKKKKPELFKDDVTEDQLDYFDKLKKSENKFLDRDQIIELYKHHASKYCGSDKGKLLFDFQINEDVFIQMAQYIVQSKNFYKAGSEYISKDLCFIKNKLFRPSFDKGICLYGNTGSGKSCLMHSMNLIGNVKNPIKSMFVNENQILSDKDAPDYYLKLFKKAFHSKKVNGIIIDELGFNIDGLELRWMRQFLHSLYTFHKSSGAKVHITTNLMIEDNEYSIENIYDSFISGRVKEMCNVIRVVSNKDYRKC